MRLIIAALGLTLMFGCYVDNEGGVRAGQLSEEQNKDLDTEEGQREAERIERTAQDKQDEDAKRVMLMCTSWEKVTDLGEEDILKKNEYNLIPSGKQLAEGELKATIWRRDVRPFIPRKDRGQHCDEQSYNIKGYEEEFVEVRTRDGNVCSGPVPNQKPIYQYLVITRDALRCMRKPSSKLYCVEHEDAPAAPDPTSMLTPAQREEGRERTLSGNDFQDNAQVIIDSTKNTARFSLVERKQGFISSSNKSKGHEFDGLTYVYTDKHDNVSQSGCPYELRVYTVKGIVEASTKRRATKFDPFNND